MAFKTVSAQDIYIYGLDTEVNSEESPYFDERTHYPIDPAKVKNVTANGVEIPILLRKAKGDEAGEEIPKGAWIVADGRQRTKWVREANLKLEAAGEPPVLLPFKVVDWAEDEIQTRSETVNSCREEDSTSVRAERCTRMNRRGHTVVQCAIHFCVSEQTVRNWLRLSQAPAYLRKAVDKGQISMTDGIKIAKEDKPREALAEFVKEKGAAKTKTGTRGHAVRPKAPLKRIREAMSLDEGTKLAKAPHYMLEWLTGRCSTEEAETHIPGFRETLKRAKAKIKREDKAAEKRDTKDTVGAGKGPKGKKKKDPEAKGKKKGKKGKPKKKTPKPAKSETGQSKDATPSAADLKNADPVDEAKDW